MGHTRGCVANKQVGRSSYLGTLAPTHCRAPNLSFGRQNVRLNHLQRKASSSVTENILRLRYKDQPVNKEMVAVYCVNRIDKLCPGGGGGKMGQMVTPQLLI
jgi:hypothetical protein